jgi:spore coat polysaccharide biosynthesis predicted glycosyltransferase SpsG
MHKNTTKRILITFGGGDDRGAIIMVLKVLLKQRMKHIEFIVVSGASNPNNDAISQWIDDGEFDNVQLKINPDFIAQLFASCDIAVMAGGTTVHEIASIGLPMILISIADNQIQHSSDWSKITQTIKYLGSLEDLKTTDLANAFNKFISGQYNQDKEALVDGLGRNRITSEIIKIREKYENNISSTSSQS